MSKLEQRLSKLGEWNVSKPYNRRSVDQVFWCSSCGYFWEAKYIFTPQVDSIVCPQCGQVSARIIVNGVDMTDEMKRIEGILRAHERP